jgi:hypothetical protein
MVLPAPRHIAVFIVVEQVLPGARNSSLEVSSLVVLENALEWFRDC